MEALLAEFGLWRRVKSEARLDPRKHKGKGYDAVVYVAQLLFGFSSGGASLADCERLDQDRALKSLLGVDKFPDQSALGEWLRAVGEEGWEALREINRDFCLWIFQKADPSRYLYSQQLECFFDDTQIEVSGRTFEEATVNYEGHRALSWQTLFTGPLMADGILGQSYEHKESLSSQEVGKDVSAHLPGLIDSNRSLWEGRTTYFYADSASSAGAYLEKVAEHFESWSVSYNKWTSPLEKAAEQFPESNWSPAEDKPWRDGSQHECQYSWVRHQPAGCQHPKLYAVVRHRRKEGELFWRYAFVVCQEQQGQAKRVFERHALKGDRERMLSQLLSDLDLHHPPCKSLAANRVFYALGMIAYNAFMALKLIYLPEEDQPKRIKTIMRHLLLIPVEIKRHARRLKVLMFLPAGWLQWWRHYLGSLMPWLKVGTQAPPGG